MRPPKILLILGTLGLCIVLIETTLFFAHWKPSLEAQDRNIAMHTKALDREFDVLVMGDSTGGNGFIPREFTRVTGKRSYNWSEVANVNSFSDIYYLQKYLERHPAPEAVFVIRSLTSWPRSMIMDSFRERFMTWGSWLYLSRYGGLRPEQSLQMLIAKLLPTYRFKHYLYRTWNEKPATGPLNYDDGYIRLDQRLVSQEIVQKDWELINQAKRGEDFAVNPAQMMLIKYMCEQATKKNFYLFVTTSPYIESFEKDPVVQGFAERLSQYVTEAFAGNDRCFMFHDLRAYPARYLANGTHLNHSGALIFTQQIASEYRGAMEMFRSAKEK